MRKHINYSDEGIDELLNITEEDDDNNGNDYTPVEVPKKPKAMKAEVVDIDQLIMSEKQKGE